MYLNIIKNNINKNFKINFRTGDIISVDYISNNKKQIINNFTGIVLSIKNKNINSSFIIKKVINNIIIEKSFKLYSPLIKFIKVKLKNKFTKSKLYYLRNFNKKLKI